MSSLQSTIYDHLSAAEHAFYNGKCKCGQECPHLVDWAAHLASIIRKDFIDVTHVPVLPPKAELRGEPKPIDANDLDAWGAWIKDTCIKFGVDVRIAWKVAGEFVYGLERERAK